MSNRDAASKSRNVSANLNDSASQSGEDAPAPTRVSFALTVASKADAIKAARDNAAAVELGVIAGAINITVAGGIVSALTSSGPAYLDLAVLSVIATVAVWDVLFIYLLLAREGRRLLREPGGERFANLIMNFQPNNLAIAGLVFAGLSLGLVGADSKQTQVLLVCALAAFLTAWFCGFLPHRNSAAVIADAMHWIGLAALAGAIAVVARDLSGVASMAMSFVLAAVVFYAANVASGWHRAAQAPSPAA